VIRVAIVDDHPIVRDGIVADFLPQLTQWAAQTVRRDVAPGFIVSELHRLSQRAEDAMTVVRP
jgi:hypothetical protein